MKRLLAIGFLIGAVIPNFVYSKPTKTLKIYGKVNPTALLSVEDCSIVKCINDNPEIEGNKGSMRYLEAGAEAFRNSLMDSLKAAKKIVKKDSQADLIIRSRVSKFEKYTLSKIGLQPGFNIIGNTRYEQTFEIVAIDAKTGKVVFRFSETAMPANKKLCVIAGANAGEEILGVLSSEIKETESDNWPEEK